MPEPAPATNPKRSPPPFPVTDACPPRTQARSLMRRGRVRGCLTERVFLSERMRHPRTRPRHISQRQSPTTHLNACTQPRIEKPPPQLSTNNLPRPNHNPPNPRRSKIISLVKTNPPPLMMLRLPGLRRQPHHNPLPPSPRQVITRRFTATIGPGFNVTITPLERRPVNTGFFGKLADSRLLRLLPGLAQTLGKIPVMPGPQQQRHPPFVRFARQHDAAGQLFLDGQTAAPRNTSTGAELIALLAAK